MKGVVSMRHVSSEGGFTLLELLAATIIAGVLIAALSTVAMTAFSMEQGASEALARGLTRERVAATLQRDMQLIVAPTGLLHGPVLGERREEMGSARADSLEFHTASGVLTDDAPWGQVRRVAYALTEPVSVPGPETTGRTLTRAVTRNLLATTEDVPEGEVIAEGVTSLSFEYYDGTAWSGSWDSTVEDNRAPLAVRVRIELADSDGGEGSHSIDLVCAIAAGRRAGAAEAPGVSSW